MFYVQCWKIWFDDGDDDDAVTLAYGQQKTLFGIIVCVIIITILIIFFGIFRMPCTFTLKHQTSYHHHNYYYYYNNNSPYSNGAIGIGAVIWTKHCVKLFHLFLCKNLYNGIKMIRCATNPTNDAHNQTTKKEREREHERK